MKAYGPVFAYLAKQLGAHFELKATTDWAGMAVAMGSGQLDIAWMGPWGYVIADNATGCRAIATAKYDEKPIYYAIIIGRPDLQVKVFPDDTKGRSMSFADVGSTSGWLIPTYYAQGLEDRSGSLLAVPRGCHACRQRDRGSQPAGRHGHRLQP